MNLKKLFCVYQKYLGNDDIYAVARETSKGVSLVKLSGVTWDNLHPDCPTLKEWDIVRILPVPMTDTRTLYELVDVEKEKMEIPCVDFFRIVDLYSKPLEDSYNSDKYLWTKEDFMMELPGHIVSMLSVQEAYDYATLRKLYDWYTEDYHTVVRWSEFKSWVYCRVCGEYTEEQCTCNPNK